MYCGIVGGGEDDPFLSDGYVATISIHKILNPRSKLDTGNLQGLLDPAIAVKTASVMAFFSCVFVRRRLKATSETGIA